MSLEVNFFTFNWFKSWFSQQKLSFKERRQLSRLSKYVYDAKRGKIRFENPLNILSYPDTYTHEHWRLYYKFHYKPNNYESNYENSKLRLKCFYFVVGTIVGVCLSNFIGYRFSNKKYKKLYNRF